MIGRRELLVGTIGALLLATASGAQQPATLSKLIPPYKGQGIIEVLPPQSSQQGNLLVTKIKVKNLSSGPLAGFTADEYWYSAKGETVSGSPTYRHTKPFMPNEIIEVTLKSPKNNEMNRVLRTFKHGNGTVKATQVAKFKADS